jgi:hypothetical protein
MCNQRSSFPIFLIFSISILMQLADNKPIIATHYGFVDVIQGYRVTADHTPYIWLSFLWIGLLEWSEHTSIFRNGTCSIALPSSCTFAGKQINGWNIKVLAGGLLLSTNKYDSERTTDSSLPTGLITEPTIEPIVEPLWAPIAAKIKSTQKSIKIPEARLCYRRLANMNRTIMKSLIGGYTLDDSMCTDCIQAKYKQKFIGVPVKYKTKSIEPLHFEVCSPFSTPTLGHNSEYILFIECYKRYTSHWLQRNMNEKTCMSGCHFLQAPVGLIGYGMMRFRCDIRQGEYVNKTLCLVLVAWGST